MCGCRTRLPTRRGSHLPSRHALGKPSSALRLARRNLEGVMNSSSDAVASTRHGESKTIPKRRLRRRVGLCRPLSGARSRRRSTAQPRAARGLQRALRWIVRTGSAWRYMPHDLPPWEATYQQRRRWLFSAGVFEEIVHDLRVHSWGFRRAGRPIRRPRYSTLALYAPPLRAALGAAMMDTSTRRAPRYTQRWILWGTCSGLVLVTPANEQERALGWASSPRPCKKKPRASR